MIKKILSLISPIFIGLILLTGTFQLVSANSNVSLIDANEESTLIFPKLEKQEKLNLPQLRPTAITTIEVSAATAMTVEYREDNNERNPLISTPHLVFSQTNKLSDPISRAVNITVTDIQIPPGVTETITLTIKTQNRDPDQGWNSSPAAPFIIVWQETQSHTVPAGGAQVTLDFSFPITIPEKIPDGAGGTVRTPTGYFQVEADVGGVIFTKDYAFLMDNEYGTDLGSANGNDYDLLVRYHDMSPYGYNNTFADWVKRDQVSDFIVTEFVPMVRSTFITETTKWGMPPLSPGWPNKPNGEPGLLTIDINENDVWYHTKAGANSSIHMTSFPGGWDGYPNTIKRQEATFYHELFHNMQGSIVYDDINISNAASWGFVNEGTAVLATSLGQPDLQFDGVTYTRLTGGRQLRTFSGRFLEYHLNKSYTFTNTNAANFRAFHYSTVLYWRYLYEQCGGGIDANQDQGMLVIWHTIAAAYDLSPFGSAPSGAGFETVVNKGLDGTGYDPDEDGTPDLAAPVCNFNNFDESIKAFAGAIYSLRLPDSEFDEPNGDIYPEPPVEIEIHDLAGTVSTTIANDIPNTWGLDYVEITVTGAITSIVGISMTTDITSEFYVEMRWLTDTVQTSRYNNPATGTRKEISLAHTDPMTFTLKGEKEFSIEFDQREFTSLAFILLRTDDDEISSTGPYTITIDHNSNIDTDGDGIPDRIEFSDGFTDQDPDGDNDKNWNDLDSDGDGLPDWVEADCDKEDDCLNQDPNWVLPDSDGDGLRDYLDVDSDNDGLPDWFEAGCDDKGDCTNWAPTTPCGAHPCNELTYWLNNLPDSSYDVTVIPPARPNSVSDGILDYREVDSDTDGFPDWFEVGCSTESDCSNLFDTQQRLVTNADIEDANNDGISDYREIDSDDDQLSDWFEANCTNAGDCSNYNGAWDTVTNSDTDDLFNFRDPDSDDDSILDVDERLCTQDPTAPGNPIGNGPLDRNSWDQVCDSDGDGTPDYLDIDSDDDAILDSVEADGDPFNIDNNNNGIPAFRDPNEQHISSPPDPVPPANGVNHCAPKEAFPFGFNSGIECGAQLIRETLIRAGVPITATDPPVPGMLFYGHPPISANPSSTVQITATTTHSETAVLSTTLNTGHTIIDGDFAATWATDAWVGTQFNSLVAADVAVYDESNTLIATGAAQLLPDDGESGFALAMGDNLTYQVSGNGSASFYAPALSTLGVGSNWASYTAEIGSNAPYGLAVQDANLIVDGQILDGDGLVLVTTGTTTLQGSGQTLAPNFANEVAIQATDAAVQFGPATVLTGTLAADSSNGLAFPNYNGALTIRQDTIALDLVELNGQASRDLALALDPITSTLSTDESSVFQVNILSNADDVYTMTVSAPAGWNVTIDSSGTITATSPLGVQPGDYPILVAAQSVESAHPLWATAVHAATVTAHEGVALSVALDPLTTVPWAQTGFSFPGDDEINNGQPQVSGAAFIATITNTSSVAHTFDVQIVPTGFSADWILLGGAGRTATTQVALPPGGSGQLGVYISPVGLAALPAEGTQYPFNVVATAVSNTNLSASDDDIFTMPAVQFAHVAAQPELIYSAPSAATSFDVTVTNVGNTTTEFPLTVDMPLSDWTIVDGWNVPTLVPGEASTQAITLTTTSGELGQVYVVGAGSQSGPYRPTAYVGVAMVSVEALPIYQAASQVAGPCAIGDNQVSLPAALRFLALSMTDLKQSCQEGSCALDLRDRVISGALASATHTAELSPLVTVDALLEQLAADMATHSDAATLNNDMSNLSNIIVQLEGEVCAIRQHQLTASFVPGTNVTLAQEPANYELRLLNEGSETTTANITLTPSTGATTSWINDTAVLAPGEELSLPVVVTPNELGTFIIKADINATEATVVHYETNAVLTAVDSLLEIINVAPVPPFIEVGSGTSPMVLAEVANVANIPIAGEAVVQLFDSNGGEVYSSTPQSIAFDSALIPLSYEAGSIATSGLLTDTYTVVVTVLDENGDLIPNATGQGLLSVGQLLSASSHVEPALVAPGDATVTTIIDTELNESILDLFASVVQHYLTLTKAMSSGKLVPPTEKSDTTPKRINQPFNKETKNNLATTVRSTALLTGTVDLTTSTINMTGTPNADGVDAATITVTALDEFGNPVADTAVWLTASGVGHTFNPAQGTTDANGVFTATLTSTQPEAKVIRALLGNGIEMAWLPKTPIIEFTGGTISGLVFSDANRDGAWQAGESGLGGVQVNLYQSGEAKPLKQVVSQSDGQYSFSSLLPGVYQVEQTRLDEYALSGSEILTVTVAGLTAVSDINFGNYAAAQVSGQTWVDSDQNGQIGIGEEPLAGVTINVYDQTSQLLDSTTTAFDGSYRFDLAADLPAAPDNFVFNNSGVLLSEPTTAVIANGDFSRGVTAQAPATYPANYDFATGDLTDWTVDNTSYVTVTNDSFSLDGAYLQISARHWADSTPFVVPAETQSLRIDYSNWDTRNPDYNGSVQVWVYSGTGFANQELIGTLSGTDNQGWQTAVLDLQDYQGETIKLHFYATEDYDRIRLDNITLQTTIPDWTTDNTTYVTVLSDTFSLDGAYLQITARHWADSTPFIVPTETQSLRIDYSNWDTRNPDYSGNVQVWVYSGTDFTNQEHIATLSRTDNQGWQTAVLDLQDYQGETIKLHFYATEDTDRIRLDNIGLYLETPGWTLSDAATVSIGHNSNSGDSVAATLENSDFNDGRLQLFTPDNGHYSYEVMPLDPATYPANYEFANGVTPQDSVTYPVNYDFTTEDLTGWAVDNTSYVRVVSDTFNLDGAYLQIEARHWADSTPFIVPTETQSLRIDYSNWDTRNPDYSGNVQVWVYSGVGFADQEHIGTLSGTDNQGWQTAVLDLQNYQGETIKLHFYATEDYDRIRLDNITLQTTVPGWTADNTSYVTVISDTFNLDGAYLQISARHWADSTPFVVPAETQSLRLDYSNWDTRSPNYNGNVQVWVYSGVDFTLQEHITTLSGTDNQGWQTAVLDLQDYQGETIKLHFYATEDTDRIRLDNIILQTTVPDWTADDTNSVTVISDTFNLDGPYLQITARHWAESPEFIVPAETQSIQVDYSNWDTRSPDYDGNVQVWVYSGVGFALQEHIATLSGTDNEGWQTAVLDLQDYQGEAIKLHFYATEDYDRIRLDNVGLYLETPSWTISDAAHAVIEANMLLPHVETYLPDNPNFNTGRTEYTTLRNYDFTHNITPQNPTTYPSNYDFATGDLESWTADNSSYVSVVSDTFNLDGPYLQISARHTADSTPFVVPLETQSLRLDYSNGDTRNPDYSGTVQVWVYSGPDFAIHEHIASLDGTENEGWKTAVLDLQEYQGEIIQLHFYATEDYDRVRLDNITLQTTVPDWTTDDTRYVTVVSDTLNLDGPYLQISARHTADSAPFVVPMETQSLHIDYSNGDTRNPDYNGTVQVWVYGGPDFAIHEHIATLNGTENEGWKTAVLDLQEYQGEIIQLHFYATEDYDRIRLDNIELYAEVPQWHPSDAAQFAIESLDGINGNYLHLGNTAVSVDSSIFFVPTDTQSLQFNYLNWLPTNLDGNTELHVDVLSGPDFDIVTRIGTVYGSYNAGWQLATLDLNTFRGQAIQLRFHSPNGKEARLDNIQLIHGNMDPLPNLSNPEGNYLYLKESDVAAYSTPFLVSDNVESLQFQYHNWTRSNANADQRLLVYVLSGENFAVSTRIDGDTVTGSYNDGWQTAVLDLQPFQGQAIKLQFRSESGKLSKIDNVTFITGSSGNSTTSFIHDSDYLSLQAANAWVASAPFDVPSEAENLHLEYFNWRTDSSNYNSTLYVDVLHGVDFADSTRIDTLSSAYNDGWQTAILDISAYAGQPIKVRFQTNNRSKVDTVYLLPTTATTYTIEEINPVNYTSTTSDTVNIDVLAGADIQLDFGDYAVDRYNSTIAVAPTELTADGISTAVVTVTVRDGAGNPLPNYNVELNAPGTNVNITQPSTATDAHGQTVGSLSATYAPQTVQLTARTVEDNVTLADSVVVTFTAGLPDPTHSTFIVEPSSVVANGTHTAVFTATLRDQYDNPVAGKEVNVTATGTAITITQDVTITDIFGQVNGTIRSTVAQTATLQVIDVTDSMTITQDVPLLFTSTDPQRSSIEAAPDTLIADGLTPVAITVTLRDQNNDPLAGKPIMLAIAGDETYLNGQLITDTVALGDSDGNGMVTAIITSTATGTKTITAFGDGIQLEAEALVTFTVGPVDADASQLTTDSDDVVANGSSEATITATLFDSFGHPVPDKEVAILASGTQLTLTQAMTTTDAAGQVQATIRSSTVQELVVTAVNQTDGITLTQTVPISFVAGAADATNSTLVISPTTVLANGIQTVTITAVLQDALGHAAADRRVQLSVTGNGNVITPTGVVATDANGEISFTLASTEVAVKDISLRDVDYDVLLTVGQVEFVFGVADADTSTLATNKTTFTADGVDQAILTATLRDNDGHPIPDKALIIQATDDSAPVTVTQSVSQTNAQGQVQATIITTNPQTVVMAAVDQTDGITLTQQVTLTAIAAGPNIDQSTILVTPATATADTVETITIDATLRDALGNLVAGRNMELLVGGSHNTISPANPTQTNADGQLIWTVTSSRAENKTLQIRDTTTGDLLDLGIITFVAGQVDAAKSTLQVSTDRVPADGTTPITVTIALRDAYNNPVPNATAVISTTTTGVNITQPQTPSDHTGSLTAQISGTTYEAVELSIVAEGITLEQTETVNFDGPDLVLNMSGPAVGVIGREVTYTLTVENVGLMRAADVELTSELPPYISYLRQSSPLTPTLNGDDPTWQLDDIVVGDSITLTLVTRLNAGAALDSQLTNEATATSVTPEENTANNNAASVLTVGPGFVYDLIVTPNEQTTAIGGEATYNVSIQNSGNLADEFNLDLNDLNTDWYSLTPTHLTLDPGEIGQATLTVQTDSCTDVGTHPFFILSNSVGENNIVTTPASLTMTAEPLITGLLPNDNTRIGSTSTIFSWQTAVTATTSLFIREVGQPTFTEYSSSPGLLHQVEVTGLSRNTDYEWYVHSSSACGSEESAVRTLTVLNGVVFSNRSYNFTVDRDYNQFRTLQVHNQDIIAHTVMISIENPYPELIVGFIGDGSIDNSIVLQPGQTHNIELGIHTQDVTIDDLDLIARLTADDGSNQPIQDAVPVNLNIYTFVFDLTVAEIASDPTTLVKTYRVTNNGDTVTDLAITANVAGTGSIYLTPSMSHGRLPAGGVFEFEAIPALGPDFQALSGSIIATAGGYSESAPIDISLPDGHSIYLGEANNMSMEATTADWYCTNRPIINNKIVLPAGFRREDVASAQFQFSANPRTGVRPHDVTLYVNNNQIGKLENTIPHGLYTFPLDPDFLNEAVDSPSVNYVTLQTEHMNGGHYIVANEMLISICLSSYREWVPATSQSEADTIVSSRSFLIPPPGTLDVTILTPTASQPIHAGVPITVTARIDDDLGRPWSYAVTMQASNGNGGLILFDDGAHGDGAYKDGIYGGQWVPLNPGETVLTVDSASCSTTGSQQTTVQVADTTFNINVDHQIPVTDTTLLPQTVQPAAETISTTVATVDIGWSHVLTPGQTSQQDLFDLILPNMQPGEVRQVAAGTVVRYESSQNSGEVTLPPLYVAAQHLVAISPSTQTVSQGGQLDYEATLQNPGPSDTLALSVAGLPLGWTDLDSQVVITAGSSITLPLTVRVPHDAALGAYPFAVIVETDTGGQDQAGATLIVSPLDFETAVSPKQTTVDTGASTTYTVTVNNLAVAERTFVLAVAGLEGNEFNLPETITIAANSQAAVPLQVTAYAGYGPHPFRVIATAEDTNVQQNDAAVLGIRGDRRVEVTLSPAIATGGAGTPVTYTLTVVNGGTLSDTYDLDITVPDGWTYRLYTDSAAVDTIDLTPYVYNSMDLLLTVTPALGSTPGTYPVTASVQSTQNPMVHAAASGELILTPYGVQVDIQPKTSNMMPTSTASWDVVVTNVGQEPDTYELVAGGIVAQSAQFSSNPVSLNPGESQTVQLTTGNLDYVIPETYPLSVMATSLFDTRIRNADTASVTFTSYEGVTVELLPATQTLTETNRTTYMMVISNTGNVDTVYNLTMAAPELQVQLETEQVYVPAKMAARVRVSVAASTAATYQLTGQATSTSSPVSDQADATLIVTQDAFNLPPVAIDDIVQTQANTPVPIDVLANDSDPEGDTLIVLAVSPPQNGDVTLNADQTITYAPGEDAFGLDSFVYTVGDGRGHISLAMVIVAINHAPTAVADERVTDEDTTIIIPVLDNDSDLDGDSLIVISTTLPLSGTAVVNLDHSISYTPTLNYHGVDSFSYAITDGQDGFATAVVTVTIQPVNDEPTALDDSAMTDEDTAVTIDVLVNDSDIDGDSLTVSSVTQPGNGQAVVNADSTISYIPDPDFNSGDSADGTDSFTYTASDGQGAAATATVVVTVTPVNDDPAPVADLVTTSEDVPIVIDVLTNDTDVDGDILTLTGMMAPITGSATISLDGTIIYTPTLNYHGPDQFTYSVADGFGGIGQASVQLTIEPVNDVPTALNDVVATDEDVTITIPVLDNDLDVDGDTLTVTAVTTPTKGTVLINPDNSISYTPDHNSFGVDSFTYTASDGQGGMDTATVSVTVHPVNDAPQAVDDASATAEETAVTIDLLANDNDVDGDLLTLESVTQPGHGDVVTHLDNTVTYTPTFNFAGSDTFTYTINDGFGLTATATVTITVSNENDNPVAVDDLSLTAEDTGTIIHVLTNDSDVDGDTLVVDNVSQPAHGIANINPDNTLNYTPDENYHGVDSFSYTIQDGHGGAATAVVSMTVTPVNDAPIAVDDTATTNEDTETTIPILDNDSDVDGDTLSVTVTLTPTLGTLAVNPDNSVTYTPFPNEHGVDSFTYTIHDGAGGTDTAVVTITVNPINDAPTPNNDTAQTNEDTAVTIDALVNDTDVDGDPLTLESITQPENGIVTIDLAGTFIYTPTANYHGADSFSYTVTDGNGGSGTADVTVAVNPINDQPEAIDDQEITLEDTAVTVAVLANDTDVDGDLPTISSVTTPTHGLVVVNPDNSVTYTPDDNFYGEDSFTYTIDDGHSAMDTASVTITITPVNDAPTAIDDATVTEENTAVTISVLDNDSDVDGDLLLVSAVTQPISGTVSINPDSSIIYTPTVGFSGAESFTYTLSDGQGGTDTADVHVTVTMGNRNPYAVDDELITDEDTVTIIDVLANDSDINGDPLTIDNVTQPTNGTLVINPDETLTYTPDVDYYGEDSFSYTVSDGHGGFDTALVTMLVKSVNDAPVAIDDTATTDQETAVTISVLDNDSDIDNDALTVDNLTQPAHGTAVTQVDNTVTYTPDAGFDGLDSFTYTVHDSNGGSDTAVVSIDVRPIAAACNLYPIALHADTLVGAQPGDTLPDILNGTQPGNYGWLTWTGSNNVPSLVASLTPPGNSHTYVNPNNANDHIVSIGDWVEGKPGVSNAKKVRNALDELIGKDIVVPVWDSTQGNGANTTYHVSGFATVRILDYQLPGQDRITVQFQGTTVCSDH